MIKTRGRKIIRDILARKGRTFLVSLSIFIGVAGVITLFSMGDILVTQMKKDLKEDDLPMLYVALSVPSGAELDNTAYLESIQTFPGLTEIQATLNTFISFKVKADDERFLQGTIESYSEPFDNMTMQPIRLVDGTYPAENSKQIAVEQRMAEEYGLKVGDTLIMRILSLAGSGQTAPEEAWTISGILLQPYNANNTSNKTRIFSTVEDSQYISGATGYNQFNVRFVDYETANEQSGELSEFIAAETPYIPAFIFKEDPAKNSQIQGARTISQILGSLALIALVVSGFLVINVVNSIVVEQKRQIGLMKSMGASTGDNFFMYSGIAFTYGLLGVIPGVIVGIPAGYMAADAISGSLNTLLEGFTISPSSIMLGTVVGLMVPVLSSLIPVFNGTRVRILEAMTDLGIDASYGSGPIAKFIGLLPIPITIRQGLSNVSIKKGRLAFTVITLTIAVGAFMGIFAIFSSIAQGLGSYLDTFNVEIGVFPQENREPGEIIGALEEFSAANDNIIKAVEPGFQLIVEVEGYDILPAGGGPPGILAYGFDVNSETPAFDVTVDKGEMLNADNADDGIIISSSLRDKIDKQVGDRIVLLGAGQKGEFEIVGISNFPIDEVWMDWRTMALFSGYVSGAPKPNEYTLDVQVNGQPFTALGTDNQFDQLVTMAAQGEVLEEAGVVITMESAEANNLAVGDPVTLTYNDKTLELPVRAIIQIPEGMEGTENIPANLVALDWQKLAELEGRDLNGEPVPQAYFVTTTLDEASVKELDSIMDDMNDTLLAQGIAAQNFNFVALVEQFKQGIVVFQAIFSMVALLIAAVGALGLLTTLSMSVFERQKEIGVMRSIGAGSATVALQFLTEGLVVGVLAWIVGLPLGYAISTKLLDIAGIGDTFNVDGGAFRTSAIIGLVGMLVITTIASVWPSISAARKTVSDILRYQ